MNFKVIAGTGIGVLVLAGIAGNFSNSNAAPVAAPNIQVTMAAPETPAIAPTEVGQETPEAIAVAQDADRSLIARNAQLGSLREKLAAEIDAAVCQRATEFFNQAEAARVESGVSREIFLVDKLEEITVRYETELSKYGVFNGSAEEQAVQRGHLLDLDAIALALEKTWNQDTSSCPVVDNWGTIDRADQTVNSAKRVRSRSDV